MCERVRIREFEPGDSCHWESDQSLTLAVVIVSLAAVSGVSWSLVFAPSPPLCQLPEAFRTRRGVESVVIVSAVEQVKWRPPTLLLTV